MSSHEHADKSYLVHALVMLAFAAALGIFAFTLVIHHHAVPERVHAIQATR